MKTKIFRLFFLFYLLIFGLAKGQAPFHKNYGLSGRDQAGYLQKTSDGNFIFSGSTTSNKSGGADILVMKITPTGDTIWTKTYGLSSSTANAANESGYSIKETNDGGYIVVGRTNSFSSNINIYSVFLFKTDNTGTIQWVKTYGRTTDSINGNITGNIVLQTTEGGYIVCGHGLAGQAFVIKTNSLGDTLWTKCYQSDFDMGVGIIQTNDKGYVISYSNNGYKEQLIKIDSIGTQQWVKEYNYNNGANRVLQTIQTSDGGFLLAGDIESTLLGGGALPDFYLIKTDASGDTLWTKEYGTVNMLEAIYSVKETNTHDYICMGILGNLTGPYEIYMIKVNTVGDTLWTRAYSNNGGTCNIVPYSSYVEPSGNIYLLGTMDCSGNNDIFFMETDLNGNNPCFKNNTVTKFGNPVLNINNRTLVDSSTKFDVSTVSFNETYSYLAVSGSSCNMIGVGQYDQKAEFFVIYPNPSSQNVTIINEQIINEIKIIDLLGQIIYQGKPNEQKVNLQIQNTGIYFVTVTCGKENTTKKLIIN